MTEVLSNPSQDRQLIVEVGAGRYTEIGAFRPLPLTRSFGPHERYVGIELGDYGQHEYKGVDPAEALENDRAMRLGWLALQASRPNEAIQFVQADARHLPIQSGTADQVIGVNVLGGVANEEDMTAILREAKRALKLNGEIVLHDFVTPRFTDMTGLSMWLNRQPDAPRLTTRLINPASPHDRYGEAVRKYGLRDTRDMQYDGYSADAATIWILKKSESSPFPFPRRPLQ